MEKNSLGIDIGSLFVKLVLWGDGEIKENVYHPHQGNPIRAIKGVLREIKIDGTSAIGVTGTNAHLLASQLEVTPINFIKAEITAVKRVFREVRNIIDIGGGSVTMIELDEKGNFQSYSTNSLCAAGTGSFLDEQAERLEIKYRDLEKFGFIETPPTIATRCSVFAKSDLIHRQQEGHSKEAMWSGLCRGMTTTLLQTLLKGKPLKGLTVLTGGVVLNREVLRWLNHRYQDQVVTYQNAHLAAACGAAELANGQRHSLKPINWDSLSETEKRDGEDKGGVDRKPLKLIKSKYPSFEVEESYIDELENEVRLVHWPEEKVIRAYLGIDIGSTSTKLLLVGEDNEVLADVYRKTLGDPVQATKNLFTALNKVCADKGCELEILGCGTTGSGRKLVGVVVGADAIINEISAHVTGAMYFDPEIDTIFEIGGQDSKYMHTRSARIRDANMNYICAAGTGSFVEEQARKLGYHCSEIGDLVMGITPPRTSDRCTVFMEQDVHKLLRQGYSRQEAMAAVMYSIAQNYLNKVVGNRYISDKKIFFQGATPRNKGLVAAFENLLDVEIVVSPFCHVMGAFGVALLARRIVEEKGVKSRFKGLSLSHRKVEMENETCTLCENHCKITFARIEGEKESPSWGYMCGRDPADKKKKVSKNFNLFLKRRKMLRSYEKSDSVRPDAPTVGIPMALTNYSFLPLWQRFFDELGFKVELSPETNSTLKQKSISLVGGEFCFPVKLAHSHVHHLLTQEGVDYVFLPYLISDRRNPDTSNSLFCPWVESLPSAIKSIFTLNNIDVTCFLSPIIDFRWSERIQLDHLEEALGTRLGRSRRELKRAWRRAMEAQTRFAQRCQEEGRKAIKEIEEKGEKAIVIVGRPYNTFDLEANILLPQRIADQGYRVIPIDFLPFSPEELGEEYHNIYWTYGQRVLNAIKYISRHPNLYAVYLTNFNCGPDSFVLSFSEHSMGDKPFLILELDEHGGDTGYLTRIEAFLDVLREHSPTVPPERVTIHLPKVSNTEFKRRTIWIPPMHPFGTRLFAAAFRSFGYQAQALKPETREDFELGRKVVRGSECLPTTVTIGGLLSQLREIKADPREHAFFMPTAEGPCRFGQYALLHRIILNREGYRDLPILSPSSFNSYQGLEEKLRRKLWLVFLNSDILFKAVCKIRPYELNPGETNQAMEQAIRIMEQAFESNGSLEPSFLRALETLEAVPRRPLRKPLVGIVGEIYVRCNSYSNEDVIGAIERFGGESWLAPITEWILYTTYLQKRNAQEGLLNFRERVIGVLKNRFLLRDEHNWYQLAGDFMRDRHEPPVVEVLAEGTKYVPIHFQGEAILTLGRTVKFIQQGAALVVNCSPFSCMPGTLTTAMFQEIQNQSGVPVVNMFYDGEGGLNDRLEIFLDNL
jgi:predicted CoA-substrate-specific enzyme activase